MNLFTGMSFMKSMTFNFKVLQKIYNEDNLIRSIYLKFYSTM